MTVLLPQPCMGSWYSTRTYGLCPQMQTSIPGYHVIFNQRFATPMCKTDMIMCYLGKPHYNFQINLVSSGCRALVEAITRNEVVAIRFWVN